MIKEVIYLNVLGNKLHRGVVQENGALLTEEACNKDDMKEVKILTDEEAATMLESTTVAYCEHCF